MHHLSDLLEASSWNIVEERLKLVDESLRRDACAYVLRGSGKEEAGRRERRNKPVITLVPAAPRLATCKIGRDLLPALVVEATEFHEAIKHRLRMLLVQYLRGECTCVSVLRLIFRDVLPLRCF